MDRSGWWRALVVPGGLLAAVLAIFVQLPPAALDFLLAANLALAVVILLTTFYVRTPLDLSVFPTVLLTATLGRLALNIASTRLILTGGESRGLAAAGQVIQSFGEFVAGDQLVVGLLIFLILVAVQFLVITKGATRISEVAARFALDGMPGRQMAVDAEFNGGMIDAQEAHRRREEIAARADFYGAMDGASKFVRGDAVAGVLILAVNLAGGLLVGLGAGLGVVESANLYAKLTIGDGLVTQIPALLISLAAGVLVTRSSRPSQLPVEVLRQLLARPQALAVGGVFLVALVAARMPAAPLLTLGAGCGALALAAARRESREPGLQSAPATTTAAAASAIPAASTTPTEQNAEPQRRVEDLLAVDPLVLELGIGLIRLADPHSGGSLLAHVAYLRERLASELGLLLPRVRVRDNPQLERHEYRLLLSGATVARGRLRPSMLLATAPHPGAVESLVGEPSEDAASGRPACWIPPSTEDEARRAGCQVRQPIDVLMDHFHEAAERHAPDLLTRDATRLLLDEVRRTAPAVVDELVPDILRLGQVQQVLQGLLSERVSIRPLARILESLSDSAAESHDAAYLICEARRRVGRQLCAALCDHEGRLHPIVLDPLLEDDLAEGLSDTELWREPLQQIIDAAGELELAGRPPVALVRPASRVPLRRLTAAVAPRLRVVSLDEVPPETELEPAATVAPARLPEGAV